MNRSLMRFSGIILIGVAGVAAPLRAGIDGLQAATQTQGRTIQAQDGDTILVEGNGRVAVVHRREGFARLVFNPAQRWLIVLFDGSAAPHTGQPRVVDDTYTFYDVGDWRLGERWEGAVRLEEYHLIGEPAPRGVGLRMEDAFIQFLGFPGSERFRDPAARAISYRGSGRSGGGRAPFDMVERRQVDVAAGNAERRAQIPGGAANSYFGLTAGVPPGTPGAMQRYPPGTQAPVRVGGNVATPRRTTYVPPVYPERARTLGIGGMVILEITIGTDGRVTDARVLRGIEMLDDAAIAAVRQWRYEPTHLNAVPVPVVMTVTVSFP